MSISVERRTAIKIIGAFVANGFLLANSPERSANAEVKNEKPAQIDFELRVITRGEREALGTYYKVRGNDPDTIYLYQVVKEQKPRVTADGMPLDPKLYERNTEVVAKYTKTGTDAIGNSTWQRYELKQPTVVIEGSANRDSCNTDCEMTSIFLEEVDSNGKPIQNGRIGAGWKNIKFIRGQVCSEWGNWGYNHKAISPESPPTELPSPTPPRVRTEQLPPVQQK